MHVRVCLRACVRAFARACVRHLMGEPRLVDEIRQQRDGVACVGEVLSALSMQFRQELVVFLSDEQITLLGDGNEFIVVVHPYQAFLQGRTSERVRNVMCSRGSPQTGPPIESNFGEVQIDTGWS